MTDPRYPLGPWVRPETIATDDLRAAIAAITALPGDLAELVAGRAADELDRTIRPGAWTVRQLVHHLADSHVNAYCRHRLALTEDDPAIRPYDEVAWSNLADATGAPVATSLTLLAALHTRWALLLESLDPALFGRTFRHPQRAEPWTLAESVLHYAWHGRHHAAQIAAALDAGRG
ncbi:MAG: hypothetical protein AMXMBFR36_27070 [Acidobacteriota bacterium]